MNFTQGYVLGIEGTRAGKHCNFLVAVGKGTQEKHRFHAGMEVSGQYPAAAVWCMRKKTGWTR
ncbi:MAG: hypothetical protein ACC669_01500 [bacterium]